ncbi:MAG: phosphoribosylformylglycinamidine synthase [Pseudomonadota bacterium]
MLVLTGQGAYSRFRLHRMLMALGGEAPVSVETQTWMIAWFNTIPSEPLINSLSEIVGASGRLSDSHEKPSFIVTPRAGSVSPWSSKATDIARNCGLDKLERIERVTAWWVPGAQRAALIDMAHDRMTESVMSDASELGRLQQSASPVSFASIEFGQQGESALAKANFELGLALSQDEIEYLALRFTELKRDPHDIELMMFAQANSEHCRHKIFNASWTLDGHAQQRSLFAMIRNTFESNPNGVLSAYSDNSAVTTGYTDQRFFADPLTRKYTYQEERIDLLMKVETHNHPTAISPFPGAATGSGGEIRDEGATGRGSRTKAGLTGFSVSHLRIPDLNEPWESQRTLNTRLASALDIMLDGPIGAAAFNNEFGRPAMCGYFRVFENLINENLVWGYDKPIMLAGGMGNIRSVHIEKQSIPPGSPIIVLGGPAMLIGLGGGAASSVDAGKLDSDLDFASVQRDNPEMQRRCQQVIDTCWAADGDNPILSIHDVGAGGLSNAIPELLHDSGRGGRIELRKIPSADESLSPLEIWCNEAQERYVLAISASAVNEFSAVCARERCPFAVIGEATEVEHLELMDEQFGSKPIDLPMDVLFGKPPVMHREAINPERAPKPRAEIVKELETAIHDVLRFPTVADKRFLITIGDRTVGGLSVRDQMVGPWQVPVADCAVMSAGFKGVFGEAMAIGERTPIALDHAPASGRMAVGEAITNIAAAPDHMPL